MRTHRAFEFAQPPVDAARARELVRADHLVAARLEPIRRHGHDEVVLDLTFAQRDRIGIVPTIVIPTRHVALREGDPLIWPASIAAVLDDPTADAIRDRVLPWLIDAVTGRSLNDERFVMFEPAIEVDWKAARERRWLGASPLAEAWQAMAPCAYARRFARDRTVSIAAEHAIAGVPILAGVARGVALDEIDPLIASSARRWFGLTEIGGSDGEAEILIADAQDAGRFGGAAATTRVWIGAGPGRRVPVGEIIPFDVAFAFHERRGTAATTLSVETAGRTPESPRRLAVPGGSSGRILLLVRPDAGSVPDADTDEARELAHRLGSAGLEVVVSSQRSVDGFDLVHVVGLHAPLHAREVLAAARGAGIPTIVSPHLDQVGTEASWARDVAEACFLLRPDEIGVSSLLHLFAGRQLSTGALKPSDGLPPGEVAAIRAALALAGTVIVAAPAEQKLIEGTFGYQGRIEIAGPLPSFEEPEDVGALVGDGAFALVCRPLEPRSNALAVLRAAAAERIPLVVAGASVSPVHTALLAEFAGTQGLIIEDPSPGIEAGLIAAARVYADCGWATRGAGRAVRAAAAGAAVVGARNGWIAEVGSGERVDPASVGAIAQGLRAAWERAPDPERAAAALERAERAFERILGAYARAGGA